MRPERNPLDLNNLPEEYGRDGKQVLEGSSSVCTEASDSTRGRRKKSGGKDGKDEHGKVYECRFCSLKFCKSQALGGHMNRHRQERETETLNRARQLVFSNETLAAQGVPHLGFRDLQMCSGQQIPSMPFRPVYQTRIFPGSSSSSSILPPQPPPPPPPSPPHHPQPYLYSSSRFVSFPSQQYRPPPPPPPSHPLNDYVVGHVLPNNNNNNRNPNQNYTCIGAPLGHGMDLSASASGGGADDESLSWGRSGYGGRGTQQQRLDPWINRYQDDEF